jgi:hypothetical protein
VAPGVYLGGANALLFAQRGLHMRNAITALEWTLGAAFLLAVGALASQGAMLIFGLAS